MAENEAQNNGSERRLPQVDPAKLKAQLLAPPELSILSDAPIAREDAEADSFNLPLRLGPVYDIARHPDTKLPLSIALYGDWGTGKTSAMRWLEGRLREWNKGGPKGRTRVFPVWFYPWKYTTKEDVWRGLVAEIIVSYLTERRTTGKKLLEEAKSLGGFLGGGFVDLLAGLKLSAGDDKTTGKVQFDLKSLEDLRDRTAEYFQPQAAHLNKFEEAFNHWVDKALGKHDRMIVFIDDLDRCMPDIALSVLEALKLYLNKDRLIFVIGVDKDVVDQLVAKYYDGLGVKEEKSRDYLAKMFQVEIPLYPSLRQVGEFFDGVGETNDVWKALDDPHRQIFRTVTLDLAQHSPREVKRLLNSAIIEGAGAALSSETWEDGFAALTVEQGMQVFFVRRVLSQPRYNRASLVSREEGTVFFRAWSKAAQDLADHEVAVLALPDAVKRATGGNETPNIGADDEGAVGDQSDRGRDRAFKEWNPPGWARPLVDRQEFRPLLFLLEDENLARLMEIDYPEEAAAAAGNALTDDTTEIDQAIALELNKPREALTAEDRSSVTSLSLSGRGISDLEPLEKLVALERLFLNDTQVSDLAPLEKLVALEQLFLRGTQVSELAPLEKLVALERLDLQGTQVSDLTPLEKLVALEQLGLLGTQVSDLAPLENLVALERVGLQGTQVSDLAPLENLVALERVGLQGTQVSDLAPLENLVALEGLGLRGTQVSDLAPLENLVALEQLFLQDTQVSDLAPLENLVALERLFLNDTLVRDLAPLENLVALEQLGLRGTQVSDLEPLENLVALERLDLQGTQVSDLAPLENLVALEQLFLQDTQVSDLAPLENLVALERLFLNDTLVRDLAPLENLVALEQLFLQGTQVSELAPLENLVALERLDLQGTQVSDLEPLEKLNELIVLDVRDMSPELIWQAAELPALRLLVISAGAVSEEALAILKRDRSDLNIHAAASDESVDYSEELHSEP